MMVACQNQKTGHASLLQSQHQMNRPLAEGHACDGTMAVLNES